jgi:hypothetical protein
LAGSSAFLGGCTFFAHTFTFGAMSMVKMVCNGHQHQWGCAWDFYWSLSITVLGWYARWLTSRTKVSNRQQTALGSLMFSKHLN